MGEGRHAKLILEVAITLISASLFLVQFRSSGRYSTVNEEQCELDFGGELNYWLENLYTESRHFLLGAADWKTVKQCAKEAQAAGVIASSELVVVSVLGGQDLLREVSRFEMAGQSMLGTLGKILMRQAAADEDMKMMGKKLDHLDRVQKASALLAAVFSFAPLGGAAAATVIGAGALPLLESCLSTGVGVTGAATPTLLDRLIFRTKVMVSPEGWSSVAAGDKVVLKEAVEALGMPWGGFCDAMRKAAAARRDLMSEEAEDGSWETVDVGGSEQGPNGEIIALVEGVTDMNSGVQKNGDRDDDGEIMGAQASVGSTLVSGLTIDNSADEGEGESTLSRLVMIDGESLLCMKELKSAAWDTKNIMLMNGETLSNTVAAVMVNFDGDLRSVWRTLADILRVVFRVEIIGGDMVVGYPEAKLQERIVGRLRNDDAYVAFGEIASSFEWRLEQYLRGLRLTNR